MLKYLRMLKHPKAALSSFYSLFGIAIILFWLKSYAVYQFEFKLGVDSLYQQFLLLINPISSALLFFGLAFFFKGKGQVRWILGVDLVLSIWLYANLVYYRFFNDFITVPTILSAKSNSGQLGDSILSLIHVYDVLYFADFFFLLFIVLKKKAPLIQENAGRYLKTTLFAAICIFLINLGMAEVDRPQLLSRSFDRNYLVKYLGTYNFTIYDIIQSTRNMTESALASSEDVVEVDNYVKANYAAPNPKYFGKAKGRNVILISLESLQNFIIDYKINDQEVTPFLNSLAHDGSTFYFPNFFNQTGQGKTSDAEFMLETGLFPLAQGSVYVNKAQNVQHALPAILGQKGYQSAVFHGNYKTFWNRNVMYRAMGYDKFFDAEFYDMETVGNTKNYGMKDKPFFTETIPIMNKLNKPFYAKLITLSNHFPFKMDEGDTLFPTGDFGDDVVNQYFQSANYLDEALKQFFDDLKANDLYKNSIIVMYGDHYGISTNHNTAMAQVLGKEEITPFDEMQLQRTVFMIVAPGIKGGGEKQTYAGEVDVRSTILHLLGIDTKDYLEMGSDMLSEAHNQVVPLRNGDFLTPQYTFTGESYYDNLTGLPLEEEPENAKELQLSVEERLNMSDQIVNKNLLRFYTPSGFKPINPKSYQYLKPTDEEKEYYTGK